MATQYSIHHFFTNVAKPYQYALAMDNSKDWRTGSCLLESQSTDFPLKPYQQRHTFFLFGSQRKRLLKQLTRLCKSWRIKVLRKGWLMMKKLISELHPFAPVGITIRVRIALQWRPQVFDGQDYNGSHYVLVDEKGSAIHAMIEECFYKYTFLMEVGKIYDISKFAIKIDTARHKVAKHDAILSFTGSTIFEEVHEDLPNFPRYSFNLLEYTQLPAEVHHQVTLADLYGCIKAVRAPQVVAVDNPKENETKTDLTIQFKTREDLRITLWGDVAKSFPVDHVALLPPPVLALFTALRIRTFQGQICASSTPHTCFLLNPDIEQREEYQAEFSKNGDKVIVTGAYSSLASAGVINEADKRTVSQLKELNPKVHTAKSVYCTALIKRFFLEKGWFFRCCPVEKCFKHMQKKEGRDEPYKCSTHEEQEPKLTLFIIITDDYDETNVVIMGKAAEEFLGATCQQLLDTIPNAPEITIPPTITAKVGQKFIFEIRIGQQGELFVRSTREHRREVETIEGSSSGKQKVSEMFQLEQPSIQTPDKIPSAKKREHQLLPRELFEPEIEKKTKRDQNTGTSSGKSLGQKMPTDLDKKRK